MKKQKLKNNDVIVNKFIELAMSNTCIKDYLIRGTALTQNDFQDGWSDYDFSLIVDEINCGIIIQVHHIYKSILKLTKAKVSITLVSKNDYRSTLHHHGIKPIFYGRNLKKITRINNNSFPIDIIDCYSNISYLIHDIRNLLIKNFNFSDNDICIHILKRVRHAIRNMIFILHILDINLVRSLAEKIYPYIDKAQVRTLFMSKKLWQQLKYNQAQKEMFIKNQIDLTEKAYALLITIIEEHFKESQHEI